MAGPAMQGGILGTPTGEISPKGFPLGEVFALEISPKGFSLGEVFALEISKFFRKGGISR